MAVHVPDFSPCIVTLIFFKPTLLKPFYSSDIANVKLMNYLHTAKPNGTFLVPVSRHPHAVFD